MNEKIENTTNHIAGETAEEALQEQRKLVKQLDPAKIPVSLRARRPPPASSMPPTVTISDRLSTARAKLSRWRALS